MFRDCVNQHEAGKRHILNVSFALRRHVGRASDLRAYHSHRVPRTNNTAEVLVLCTSIHFANSSAMFDCAAMTNRVVNDETLLYKMRLTRPSRSVITSSPSALPFHLILTLIDLRSMSRSKSPSLCWVALWILFSSTSGLPQTEVSPAETTEALLGAVSAIQAAVPQQEHPEHKFRSGHPSPLSIPSRTPLSWAAPR